MTITKVVFIFTITHDYCSFCSDLQSNIMNLKIRATINNILLLKMSLNTFLLIICMTVFRNVQSLHVQNMSDFVHRDELQNAISYFSQEMRRFLQLNGKFL